MWGPPWIRWVSDMTLGSGLLVLSSLFAAAVSSPTSEGCGHVFVTISPLLSGKRPGEMVSRRLAAVNWNYVDCHKSPAAAAIYEVEDFEPEPSFDINEAVWWSDVRGSQGFVVSNYSVPLHLPGRWAYRHTHGLKGQHCYPFQVVMYDSEGRLMKTTCLSVNPTWMEDLITKGAHKKLTLTGMMLPGSHNSGCYSRSGEVDNHMVRYLLTQEATIWEQLVHGVRYFDMRVGYYPQNMGDQQNETHPDHGHRYWVNHDMVRIQPLQPVLKDIATFLSAAKKEFVVLDFHRFPVGFSAYDEYSAFLLTEPHKDVLNMIKSELGEYIIPHNGFNPLPTLSELLKTRGRVIVSYGDKRWLMKERWLWPPVPQLWGNQQTTEGLLEYLDNVMDTWAARLGTFWAAMAELTPTMVDILFNFRRSSLRTMANEVNHNVSLRARGPWFRRANIIASDFVLGTDLVNIAIDSNIQRAAEKKRR